ncbi:hypothetical protein [Corynebacterium xerosis]|uniref:DUF2975 domain-containing protein n=1 Tax=Corynebacterium xerosis TaxID=1725 RepID=A0ABV3UT72_9CORY
MRDNAPGPVEEAVRMDREVIRRLWASGLPSALPARVRAHRLLQRCAPAWTAVAVVVFLGWGRLLAWTLRRAVREVIEEDRKLPVRLKLDLRYVAASVQAAQASFFGVLVFAGFVFLGLVSVPEATIATWTGKPPAMVELGPLDIPGALVKVSWVLGAFASLYMVTATAADKAAREEQLGPITGETRAVLKAANVLGDADGGAVARK